MRRLLFAVLAVSALACFGDDLTGSATMTGTYTLRTVNGAVPPAVMSSSGGVTVEALDDTLKIFQGETYAISGHVRTTSSGQVTTTATLETGTVVPFGTSVNFTRSDGQKSRQANYNGASITFVEAGLTRVYTK